MTIDEMARASAHRTTTTVAAATDTEAAYRVLVTLHRRRTQAKLVAVSAVMVAVLLVIFVGTGGSSSHRSEPISPQPAPVEPYKAAPPLCGPGSFGQELAKYAEVGHTCPTGPGRYLSELMGVGSSPPFAFTLPAGWTLRGLAGVGGGPVMPALGGLLLQAPRGGDALVLAELPTEVPAFQAFDGSGQTPREIAARLATHELVLPTHEMRTTLGGREAWRVDLVQGHDTSTDGFCVTGDRCAVTFALGGDDYPGRSYVGVVPGVPSSAYLLNGTSRGITTLAWTFGDPDGDRDLAQVLASIDFQLPVCPADGTPCDSAAAPYVGTWYSSVSATEARAAFHALVGDWSLTLNRDGSARLARSDGRPTIDGGWTLDGPDLNLGLAFPGCATDDAEYQPNRSTLHPGLLELVSIEGQESCQPRSLVIEGHWSPSPGSHS